MALLTSGYWPSTYWPSAYWVADYWPEYEVGVEEVTARGMHFAKKHKETRQRRKEQEIMNIIKAFIKVQGDRP